jgi:hypothetical protein
MDTIQCLRELPNLDELHCSVKFILKAGSSEVESLPSSMLVPHPLLRRLHVDYDEETRAGLMFQFVETILPLVSHLTALHVPLLYSEHLPLLHQLLELKELSFICLASKTGNLAGSFAGLATLPFV